MSTFIDMYKSASVGTDICVTCLSVCRESQLQTLAEDTTILLRHLLYDVDFDRCLKLLRPNKKLNLCKTCHKTLSNTTFFRNRALKSLLKLQKEWQLNQLQQNAENTSKAQIENTLHETADIKIEIEPYPKIESDPLQAVQSSVFTHKTPESVELPIDIKHEYDSDDCALSELYSVSSKNEIVPKKQKIEAGLLDCEEKIASSLLRKGDMNLGLESKTLKVFSGTSQGCSNDDTVKLKLIAPVFEASHPTQASTSCDQLKSKPVEKVEANAVEKPVKKSKSLPAKDQTMILSETESECDSEYRETKGVIKVTRKKWYITVVSREQLLKKREENLKDPKYISAVYKCEYCGVPFEEKAFQFDHDQACNAKKTSDGAFTCFVCGCSFKALLHLTAHARYHSAGCHAFQCSTCEFTTTKNYLVARHQCPNKGGKEIPPKDPTMVLTKARRQYYCPECDYTSHYQPVDTHYKRFHKNDCQVKCEVCGKMFRNSFTHRHHVQKIHAHPKPKPNPEDREVVMFCAPCGQPFYSIRNYHAHMQTLKHTPKDQITFKCDECPRKFHLSRLLENHKKTHELERTGQKPYKCGDCGAAYIGRAALRYHIRVKHTPAQEKSRNHICDVCGDAFFDAQILRGHMARHSDVRPYKCEYCGDTFKFSSALYTHIKLKHKKKKTKPDDEDKGTSKSARNRKRRIEKGNEHEQRIDTHEQEKSVETKEHEQSMETDEHDPSMGLSDYGLDMEPLAYDQMLA